MMTLTKAVLKKVVLLESVKYNGKILYFWKSENPGFKCLFV